MSVKARVFMGMALLLGAAAAAQGAIVLDKVMAIVNKEVITWSDLYKGMEFDAVDEVKALKPEERRRFFKDNEATYLESMIDMKLQLQEARREGIGASTSEVEAAIATIRDKYGMSEEAFSETIKKEGFALAEYKKKLAEQITISRIVEQEVRSKIFVTEADIDRYLAEHKELARDYEGFTISQIFLKDTGDRKQVEEKASEIYKRVKAGESFSELARRYSEDASARSGGSLGFIRKCDLSSAFVSACSGLKTGEVSEPFWSESGMHIIRVNDARTLKNPQELRDIVRERLLNEKFERDYKNWIKGLRERAYVEVKI